jgi:hypothetical protein
MYPPVTQLDTRLRELREAMKLRGERLASRDDLAAVGRARGWRLLRRLPLVSSSGR